MKFKKTILANLLAKIILWHADLESTLCFKKTRDYPFYFCNNFFIREPTFHKFFGYNVAKEISNMQSLTWLLAVRMSYSWEPA